MANEAIYLGNESGKVLGPYHPDEISAYATGRVTLGYPHADVYRITAASYEDARRKLTATLSGTRRKKQPATR